MIDSLFEALKKGDDAAARELLQADRSLANAENAEGLTALGYAAHYGHQGAVRTLLEFGADVNAVSHSRVSYIPSNTALHAAIAGERSVAVIQLLLEHNARTDIFDSNGHTCLHTAAFHDDNTALIELLLRYGADLNAKQDGGAAPLSIAAGQGNEQVAELLRSKGAE